MAYLDSWYIQNLGILRTHGIQNTVNLYMQYSHIHNPCKYSRNTQKPLNGIKVQVFFEKNIEKKHLCHHDKDYCYSCKSYISVINLILCSSYMIKLSKNMSFKKLDKRCELFSPTTDNFLAFFIVFEWARILESAMHKKQVICNAEFCPNYFSVNVSVLVVVFHKKITQKTIILPKIFGFLKIVGETQ